MLCRDSSTSLIFLFDFVSSNEARLRFTPKKQGQGISFFHPSPSQPPSEYVFNDNLSGPEDP